MDLPNYNNIKNWADWFVASPPALRYGLALIVGVIVGACIFYFVGVYGLFDIHSRPKHPTPDTVQARPDIATFGNEWPRTNMGTELNIFSDVKFLNRSSVSYETIKHPEADDYFLRIYFALERSPRSLIGDAYCGVYLEWTDPPPRSVDASSFAGLRLKASYSLGAKKTKPRFILSIATLEMKWFNNNRHLVKSDDNNTTFKIRGNNDYKKKKNIFQTI